MGGDPYVIHCPGDTPYMRSKVDTFKTHAFKMRGIAPFDSFPGAPLLTWIDSLIAWRGEAYADKYTIQRSVGSAGPWTTICYKCADDTQTPWTDATRPAGQTIWYQIIAHNISGAAGTFSPPAISLGNSSPL